MGIRAFFHKIKTGFERMGETSIPYVDETKKYGNYGENEFISILYGRLPSCKIKRNVVINTCNGNAEIDCLILYNSKLFAIEVKKWKGRITENENGFLQEKTDRWTGEVHTKYLKSPFKQLGRAIYMLREQIPIKAWINAVVFFENDGSEHVSCFSDNVWFDNMNDLLNYIQYDGKSSIGGAADSFFAKCVPADCLYSNAWEKSLNCIINRESLQFWTPWGKITANNIISIRILHHWSFDELHIQTTDGTERIVEFENASIQVYENGSMVSYAFCKLDFIRLGRTINC